MGNSTATFKRAKPFEEFPLFPDATDRWAKKNHGKFQYFGKSPKPVAALVE